MRGTRVFIVMALCLFCLAHSDFVPEETEDKKIQNDDYEAKEVHDAIKMLRRVTSQLNETEYDLLDELLGNVCEEPPKDRLSVFQDIKTRRKRDTSGCSCEGICSCSGSDCVCKCWKRKCKHSWFIRVFG